MELATRTLASRATTASAAARREMYLSDVSALQRLAEAESEEDEQDDEGEEKGEDLISSGNEEEKGKVEEEDEAADSFLDAEPAAESGRADCSTFEADAFFAVTELALQRRLGSASWPFSKVLVAEDRSEPLTLRDGSGKDDTEVSRSWAWIIGNRSSSSRAITWAVGERRNIATAIHALACSGHLRMRHCTGKPSSSTPHGSLRVYLSRDFCDGVNVVGDGDG